MADEYARTGTMTTTTSTSGAVGTADTNRPDVQTPAYSRMLARGEKCRALMIGLEAIRAGGVDYLPQYENETEDSYETRQNLAALANGFELTVLAAVGLIMQTPPKLGEDMPARLVQMSEDVDRAGTHLDVFAWLMFLWAIVDGRAGILVDYPKVPNARALSGDEETRLGLRPYFLLFQSPDIYLALREVINGVKTITLLVLRERVERRAGRFGVADVTRFRIYSREQTENGPVTITSEVWESPTGETGNATGQLREVEAPLPMAGVTAIPFALFLAGQEIAPGEVKPPLLDLAELVIEHHVIKTDIRHLESLACVPTLVRKGYVAPNDAAGNPDPAPVILGPRSVQDLPVEGALEWLTPDISVLEPAMKTLANNEAAQGAAGLAFLTPETRAAETAEAKRIDAAAQHATLSTIARRGQDTLEAAFGFAGQFMREATSGSVTINTDFENSVLDAATIAAFGTLAANGLLSIETLLSILEMGKRLPDGFDKPEELRRILAQMAPSPADRSTTPPDPVVAADDATPPAPVRTPRSARITGADGTVRTITIE